MIRRLAEKFIPDADRTDRPEVRLAYGKLAGFAAIGVNLALCLLKVLTGLAARSVAIVADGINNLSDAASNIVSLLGFRLAAKPADEEHPYGHGRYEYLAGLTVAVLVLVAGLELLKSSLERIFHPVTPDFSWPMAIALAVSILAKLWMMVFNKDLGGRIGSKTLLATAADSRNDAISTAVVLAGMAITRLTGLDLDGWLGVGVAVFVLYSGFTLVKGTLDPLLGQKPDPEVVDAIRQRIEACPAVLATHDLMLHDYGPGRRFASAHVEVSAEEDPMAWHGALDDLARTFWEQDGLHIVFQPDPISQKDSEANRLRAHMIARMGVIDPRLTVHDMHVTHEDGHARIRFDCFVPPDVNIPEPELRRMLENIVRVRFPDGDVDITIDRGYMSPQ